ncbi:hypothetical protein MtrunA17_Chr3g0116841 [Medicago truncatula]|nr:hypothetical protein MtrunA17_Chr3g0116841 [Medicago truncatula]
MARYVLLWQTIFFPSYLKRKDLHQYDVTVTPEATSRGVNCASMEQFVSSKMPQTIPLQKAFPLEKSMILFLDML